MVMPRSLSGLQYEAAPVGITVALLLPEKPQQVWLSCAPSVTRKTKGLVLVDELPSPTFLRRLFILGNAFSKWVPPEPRFVMFGVAPVSSRVARFAAA